MNLNLNQQNILRLLSDAFSNSNTFVLELLQNARRAGATEIQIETQNDEFVIRDNGCGFGKDFKSFDSLTDKNCPIIVGQSNWENCDDESPYGVGFLAAVMASHSYKIECTNGWTTVSLQLKKPLDFNYQFKLRGFPVNISWNGTKLQRIPNELEIEIEGVGVLKVPKNWDNTKSFILYLQGFPLRNNDYGGTMQLHLDPKLYKGRMPDRDELIDSPGGEFFSRAVDQKLLEVYEHFLRGVEYEPSLKLYRNLPTELVNQVQVIPLGVFSACSWEEVTEINVIYNNDEMSVDFKKWNNDYNLQDAPFECFVLAQNEIATRRCMSVPDWAQQNRVDIDADLEVIANGETFRNANVVVADSFTLKLGEYEVEVSDSFWCDSTLHVVGDIEDVSIDVFRSDTDFEDDYSNFDSDEAQEKLRQLQSEYLATTGGDLTSVVRVDPNRALAGKKFRVEFDQRGRPAVSLL